MNSKWYDQIRSEYWICLILSTAVFVVYWPVHLYHFILFDDSTYVLNNPSVKEGLSLSGISWAIMSAHGSNWHPLTWMSHMLDVSLFGMNPGWHHIINVIIHMANSLLLILILRCMTGSLWLSAVTAALFALHPINVESVAWISERKNLLCAFWGLLTIWAYLRYVEHPHILRYSIVFVFYALGLMAKPMLVTLPFALILLDYWPLGRIRFQRSDEIVGEKSERTSALRLFKEKIPLFALSGASSIVTYLVQQSSGAVRSLELFPLHIRIGNAMVSYVRYVIKLIWPFQLSIIYPYPHNLSVWDIGGCLVLLIFASGLAIVMIRNHPFVIIGWFWYLGTLVPVIGLVQVGQQALADRYAYIPAIGLFVAAVWGGFEISTHLRLRKTIIAAFIGLLLLSLSVISRNQIRYWENSINLFQHATEVTSDNHIAHHNLALGLLQHNRVEDAIDHFNKALHIRPSFPKAHNNLGTALAKKGMFAEAIRHYSEALRLKPDYAGALYNMGNTLVADRRFNEAIDYYYQALAITPKDPEIHNNLGNVLFKQKRIQEALNHYQRAIAFQSEHIPALLNLAKLYVSLGNHETARSYFKKVLRSEPNNPRTCYYIAVTYARENKTHDSVEWLRKAIQKGFSNWEFLKTDNQLDGIRDSSDFRKFIEDRAGRQSSNQ